MVKIPCEGGHEGPFFAVVTMQHHFHHDTINVYEKKEEKVNIVGFIY